MKYEDTILKTDEIDHIIKTSPNLYDNFTINKILDVCKKQAEVSFKAAIKEMEYWIEKKKYHSNSEGLYPGGYYIFGRVSWKRKLREMEK